MTKNIVILFDGTSNEISSNRTNVLRLFGALEKSNEQVVYYSPGVGTFGADNALSYHYRKFIELIGMATGWGLDHNVKQAYRFLIKTYDRGSKDRPRDRIYIVGFSRGAYAARVLAGFIAVLGLIPRHQMNLLNAAFRACKAVNERAEDSPDWAEINLYERMLRPDHPPIECLGLFDTVASVWEWGRHGPRFRLHAATSDNIAVKAVRHAVALEERRTLYAALPWTPGQDFTGNRFRTMAPVPQDLREVWFAGVHTDVGGGLPEADSALAKVPLVWMIEETRALGLRYIPRTVNSVVLGKDPRKAYVAPDAKAAAGRSMNLLWALVEFIPQRAPRHWPKAKRGWFGWIIPLFRHRPVPPGALVHASVAQRDALPPNVPKDAVLISPKSP